MREIDFDTVVIGGGPAGSAAAIQLARAGRPVCLFERKERAHDKVCGEFISWEAACYLRDLGIDLPALGAEPVDRVRLFDGDDVLESALPFRAWSLSRRKLDEVLLGQAARAGASMRRGETVRSLSRAGDAWALSTNKHSARFAKAVFLASGKHELRDWRRRPSAPPQETVGLKMHLELEAAQRSELRRTVEMYLFEGGYAGLEAVENGAVNLCFLVHSDVFKRYQSHWSELLAWLSSTSPRLESRLAGALSLWPRPLAVVGTPYGYIHQATASAPELYRLGDQMAVTPSFAGDGIAMALHSGFLAARVHERGNDSNFYHAQVRRDFRRPVRNAQILAAVLSRKYGRRFTFSLARQYPGLAAKVIAGIRLNETREAARE